MVTGTVRNCAMLFIHILYIRFSRNSHKHDRFHSSVSKRLRESLETVCVNFWITVIMIRSSEHASQLDIYICRPINKVCFFIKSRMNVSPVWPQNMIRFVFFFEFFLFFKQYSMFILPNPCSQYHMHCEQKWQFRWWTVHCAQWSFQANNDLWF